VVKRTGGNLSQVLRQTGSVLQDKIELKRELRTTIAAKQMEFQIMCAVPYGILLYLKLCAPAMSSALYHNAFGILFMWGVLGVHFGLKLLGEKIIRGEVGKLEG
jgi:tight adherence protein B